MAKVKLHDQLAAATDIDASFCVACGQPDTEKLHDARRCPGRGGTRDAVMVSEALDVYDVSCREEPDLDDLERALHCAIVGLRMARGA